MYQSLRQYTENMENKNQDRRIYLVNKMLDGAKILHEFFEELRFNKNGCPAGLADKLLEKYDLTTNQRAFLEQVVTRASRAQEIVKYLGGRFGLNNKGVFTDTQGLYSVLYRTKNPPKKITALSYNIAVGFVRERWINKKEYLGFVHRPIFFDQLQAPLEQTVSRLENGKPTACADLCFSMPNLDYLREIARKRIEKETPESKLLRSVFGPDEGAEAEKIRKGIEKHELRHIFDTILGTRCYPLPEFVAGLYEADSSCGLDNCAIIGLMYSLKQFSDITKRREDRLLRLKEIDAPSIIIKHAEEDLEKSKKTTQRVKDEAKSLYNSINQFPREEYPTISYIISTTGDYETIGKFAHRLELLAEFYSQKGNR